MKHTDFEIGTNFYTVTGQRWLYTDVGSRTILAIELDPKLDNNWFKGPPYIVEEIVFDEKEIQRCFRNDKEHIKDRLENHKQTNHPGFPADAFSKMMEARFQPNDYPHKRLLRFDRVDEIGEIYHPYAAEKEDNEWMILVYLPFTEEFKRVKESVFIGFEASTEGNLLKRKNKI